VNQARIVFLSLFLGLVSGPQQISLEVDPVVKSVKITLGGRDVTTLAKPPWSSVIDFGPEIEPVELAAIGYDDHGNEIARTSQVVNLPRPVAEVEIVVRNEEAKPAVAELRWQHRTMGQPKRALIQVDGASQPVGKDFSARLPVLDWTRPHVIAAEMDFDDGAVARRELVLGGASGFSDSIGTELTPVLVTQTSPAKPPSMEGCFSADGRLLRVGTVETASAMVILIKDPDWIDRLTRFAMFFSPRGIGATPSQSGARWDSAAIRNEAALDRDTTERILWPTSKRIVEEGRPTTFLFEPSNDVDASAGGMLWLLTRTYSGKPVSGPRQFADAVATAGVMAIARGQRRAVVLLFDDRADQSVYPAATVRRYLARIGVPLFVWSISGPRPDLANSWGPVDDVSTVDRLEAAAGRLRRALAAQRVAWIAVDPLTALHVETKENCGIAPVARPH
jgi:hypothetical protein